MVGQCTVVVCDGSMCALYGRVWLRLSVLDAGALVSTQPRSHTSWATLVFIF